MDVILYASKNIVNLVETVPLYTVFEACNILVEGFLCDKV
jgi:hypothetical protein